MRELRTVLMVVELDREPGELLVGAEALAFALDAAVLRATFDGPRTAMTDVLHAVDEASIVACAMPLDPSMASHTGEATPSVIAASSKPLLLVPAHARMPQRGRFERVLVPLEGTAETSDAIGGVIGDLRRHGASILAVHVFDSATTPRFWDQTGHAEETWAVEFASCWCDVVDVDLHLRRGDVATALLDLATTEGVDLITLGWNRVIAEDRAAVVRAVLSESATPVLLVPVRTGTPA